MKRNRIHHNDDLDQSYDSYSFAFTLTKKKPEKRSIHRLIIDTYLPKHVTNKLMHENEKNI